MPVRRIRLWSRLALATATAVCIAGAVVVAQATCTPTTNLGLCKGARGSLAWDQFLNANFDLIDARAINTQGTTQVKSGTLTAGGLGVSTFTPNSVVFAGVGGLLSQNASQFVWDRTNNRLGVGLSSPSYTLDVSGTTRTTAFRMPTGASNGYVLTSDGSGVGTWQVNAGGAGGGGWTDGGSTVSLTTLSDKVSLIGASATEKLEVGGGVKLASASGATPAAGVIEWDGTHFRGYTGGLWKNLDEVGGGGGSIGGWVDNGTTITLETATDDVGVGGAGTSTQKVAITPEANQTALGVTGFSLTGSNSTPVLDLNATWNTSAAATFLSASLTNTASGPGSKFADFQVGGTSMWGLALNGTVTQGGGLTMDYETTGTTGVGLQLYRGSGGGARADYWRLRNIAGVLSASNGTSLPAWSLTSTAIETIKGSNPTIYLDASVDYHLRYDSGHVSVFLGSPLSGTPEEIMRWDSDDSTAFYGPMVVNAGVRSNLTPTLPDTYDLGGYLTRWREANISQINAVVFAEQTLTLLGGWFSVSADQGSFPTAVTSSATTIDFGKTMTVGHFVEVRSKDLSGVLRAEYLQVGSLVSGTTYNVTRGLNGAGVNWPEGTPFRVNGTTGNGRIELNAYDTPRLSLLLQGASYNSQTEIARFGDLNGMPGVSTTTYGVYIGDASNYLKFSGSTLTIAGNGAGITSINGGNIQTGTVTATQVATGTLTADRLNISTLSAITANLGTVTAGSLSGVTATFGQVSLGGSGIALTPGTAAQDGSRSYKFTGGAISYAGTSYYEVSNSAWMDLSAVTSKTTTVTRLSATKQAGSATALIDLIATATTGNIEITANGGGTVTIDTTSVLPAATGTIPFGSLSRKWATPYFSLTQLVDVSGFVPVVTNATGAFFFYDGYSGCLSGKTVVAGIVTSTGC